MSYFASLTCQMLQTKVVYVDRSESRQKRTNEFVGVAIVNLKGAGILREERVGGGMSLAGGNVLRRELWGQCPGHA